MSEHITLSEIQIKAIKGLCQEMSDSMFRATSERDLQKEAVKTIAKEHELAPAMLKKMARVYHKSTFATTVADADELQSTYTQVFGDTK
jgi:hypothetical protein